MSEHEQLQDRDRRDVLIYGVSIPQIISGFIFWKVGNISQDTLFYPIVRTSTTIPQSIREQSLVLFNRDTNRDDETKKSAVVAAERDPTNSFRMKGLIEQSTLEYSDKTKLKRLSDHLGFYRNFSMTNWTAAREAISRIRNVGNVYLHDFLGTIISANFGDPGTAFIRGIQALDRLYSQEEMNFHNLGPMDVVVDRLKSEPNEPDQIEEARFKFEKIRSVFLSKVRRTIIIGGGPHSGKSTFATSLFLAMKDLIRQCEEMGILGEGEVRMGFADLDRQSRTMEHLLRGEKPAKEKRPWNSDLLDEALRELSSAEKEFNIVIADLPGGSPDELTSALSWQSRYSILVHQSYDDRRNTWRDFLGEFPQHNQLMDVTTRLHEPDRVSGIWRYDSVLRGDKKSQLFGRAVDLDLVPNPEDPFIQFAAKTLIFDYLPGEIIGYNNDLANLHQSLRPRLYSGS